MFVQIEDYPDYSINEYGEVKSKYVNKKLKPRTAGNGYFCYQLRNNQGKKNEYIHRLVAKTFIPNPEKLPQVDHIDGNKSNNHVSNLRWVTPIQNFHAYGYEERMRLSAEHCAVKVVAVNGDTKLYFNSKSDLLRHFGYKSVRIGLKIGEKYNYGKLKGFTIYCV